MSTNAGLRYRGRRVFVPPTAEVPAEYLQVPLRGIVQEAISGVPPWDKGEDPIQTIEADKLLEQAVIERVHHEMVFWAIHRSHKAKVPQPSPFVIIDRPVPKTKLLTVELAGMPDSPILARVYPGDYVPPQPWQKSARFADGGREACVEFWRRHAYIYQPDLVVANSQSNPPAWFAN